MISVPPFLEFPFDVPLEVTEAILECRRLCEADRLYYEKYHNQITIDVYTLQWVDEKALEGKKALNWHSLKQTDQLHYAAVFVLSNKWRMDNPYITIIRDFIETHFESVFDFRLHILPPEESIWDLTHHAWPRIVIPANNSDCKYNLLVNGVRQSMYFKVGKCYLWDVRYPHFSFNESKTTDRVIGLFFIDPDKESKLKLLLADSKN